MDATGTGNPFVPVSTGDDPVRDGDEGDAEPAPESPEPDPPKHPVTASSESTSPAAIVAWRHLLTVPRIRP
ncbi:MAG: hypothetical protein ACRDN9_11770 [Streptosporangiaceae bacterium]